MTSSRDASASDAIRELWTTTASLYRCNGTPEEVAAYAEDGAGDGWNIPDRKRPKIGDLLVGIAARHNLIVDVCRVEGVALRRGGGFWVKWSQSTDVPLLPGIRLTDVTAPLRPDLPQNWTQLEGTDARGFIDSLIAAIKAPNVTYDEGAERIGVCRERSRKLRQAALKRYKQTCFICGLRPVATFGEPGLGALDCHHLEPMATQSGQRKTPIDDVRILCASCHRLAHTYPVPDVTVLETVRSWWEDARAAGRLVGPMPF